MKTKLSAVAAIVATVLGVMAGGAPAHATPSAYTPTAGSTWASWSATTSKSFSITSGPAGSVTFALPANTTLANMYIQIPLDPQNNMAYWADGIQHTYTPTVTLTGPGSTSIPVTMSPRIYGDLGEGASGNYSNPATISGTTPGTWKITVTAATRVAAVYSQAFFEVSLNSLTNLGAGSYTLTTDVLRDGLAISGSHLSATSPGLFRYNISTDANISQTYPGDTGNTDVFSVQMATCVNSSLLTVGDVLSYHRIVDGTDFVEGGPPTSAMWSSWASVGAPSYFSGQWQPTLTVTSAMVAGDFSVSKSMYPLIQLSDSGTHTVGLSITNQNGTEVSKSCAPTATPLMTVTDNGPMSQVSISIDIRRPAADAIQVRILDAATQAVVPGADYMYVPNTGNSTTTLNASSFTAGHTYNVSYRLGRGVQAGTVYGAWSNPVSYSPAAIQAPVITSSNGVVTATIPGIGQNVFGYAVVAYAPNNTSTILAGANASWNVTANATVANFYLGAELNYSTSYVFGWCQGIQMWNQVSNSAAWTCTSAVSPLTATYTTGGLPAPTASVMSTTVMLSGGSGMSGGYVFYAANNTNTPVYTTSSSSVDFMTTQSLSYGTSYVVKYCPTVSYVSMIATCTSQTLSPASNAFSVTAPSMGYTRGVITSGTAVGSAVAGASGLTVPSGISASGNDGNGGRFLATSSGTTVTVTHVTQAGSDSTFGGSGSIAVTAPASVMGVQSVNWNGNRDKYGLVIMDQSGNYAVGTGPVTGGAATVYSVTNASMLAACVAAYGTATSGTFGSFIPNPMGQLYVNGRCGGVPVTYSDSTTGTTTTNVIFKVTGNNTITVAGKLWTPSASATNWYAASGVSSTPDISVNPTATGSDTAVTFVYLTAARASVSSSSSTITSGALKVGRLAADGTFTVTDLSFAIPFVTGTAAKSIAMYEVNDGTNVLGLLTDSSGQTRAYATARIGANSVSTSTLTMDSNSAFVSGSQNLLNMGGVIPPVSGTLWGVRRISSMSLVYAPVKIDLGAGTITTFEGVTFTSTTPSLDTWLLLSLNSSGNPSVLYTTGLGVAATMYWRTVAVVGNQQSSDASATISVNDGSAHTVQNSGTLNVANGVTSVTTTVTPTESHATVGTITGGSNLQVGNNTVSFTVTAQDGSTQNYSFTVVRAAQVMPTYVLTFDKNNQSATGTMATVSSSSSWAIPNSAGYSLTGYSFNGWNTLANGNGTSYAAGASVNLTADLTLYAQWLIDPFVLTFDKNNNSATGSQAAVISRTSWSTPATVGYSLSGYLLDGWTTNANGTGTSYGSNAAVTLTQNTTLYAKWTQIPNDAVLCSVGTYSSHGGYRSTSNSWTCTDAPAGSFVATAGALTANLCPAGYFSAAAASTACIPASAGHFVASAGSTAEVSCPANTHAYATGSVACDPDRVLSGNNKAKVIIGGKVVAPGATLRLSGAPNGLNVNVEMSDNRARAYVTVPANPVVGDNLVTVFVEAENGSVAETTVIVHIDAPVVTPPVVTPPVVTPPVVTPPVVTPPVVTPPVVTPPAKSSDASAVITVAGITVADGDHVNLPFGTASVPVVVTPTESHATYAVTGATGLQTGTSVLTVTVTAEDGTVKAYSYQLVVAADMSPVNLGTANASVLQQVTAALDAGRVAFFSVTAKGAAAATKVLAQIRAFKTDLRAAGSTAKVSFSIKVTGASAVASVKVTP